VRVDAIIRHTGITRGNLMNLQEQLAADILFMMAGNYDRWQPIVEPKDAKELVRCAALAAQGIAKKLTEAIAQTPGEMNQKRWQRLVEDATRNAFMEVTDRGPLVRLGQISSFVVAVVEATSARVAPAGSEWALAIEELAEKRIHHA
jgi:hypothetical protein